jgi:hypothetical protein
MVVKGRKTMPGKGTNQSPLQIVCQRSLKTVWRGRFFPSRHIGPQAKGG